MLSEYYCSRLSCYGLIFLFELGTERLQTYKQSLHTFGNFLFRFHMWLAYRVLSQKRFDSCHTFMYIGI